MPGRGYLFDALPERTRAAANVKDLGLIQRNFNCTRPNKVSCCVYVCKGCVHRLFPPPPWGQSLLRCCLMPDCFQAPATSFELHTAICRLFAEPAPICTYPLFRQSRRHEAIGF